MKASSVVAPPKMVKEVPDLEEALEETDDEEVVAEAKEDDDDGDLAKDKYIKQPKTKKAATGKKAASKRKNAQEE
jgi:replication factor C subunit 1